MSDDCICGEDALDAHPCPYQEDVNDVTGDVCNCCEHCTQECADDI